MHCHRKCLRGVAVSLAQDRWRALSSIRVRSDRSPTVAGRKASNAREALRSVRPLPRNQAWPTPCGLQLFVSGYRRHRDRSHASWRATYHAGVRNPSQITIRFRTSIVSCILTCCPFESAPSWMYCRRLKRTTARVRDEMATVLGRVKRLLLAMLACKSKLRVAAAPLRAFDSPCAPRLSERVGTKGVPTSTLRLRRGSNKGRIVRCARAVSAGPSPMNDKVEAESVMVRLAERGAGGIRSQGLTQPTAGGGRAKRDP
jgi:hypothetical protein